MVVRNIPKDTLNGEIWEQLSFMNIKSLKMVGNDKKDTCNFSY